MHQCDMSHFCRKNLSSLRCLCLLGRGVVKKIMRNASNSDLLFSFRMSSCLRARSRHSSPSPRSSRSLGTSASSSYTSVIPLYSWSRIHIRSRISSLLLGCGFRITLPYIQIIYLKESKLKKQLAKNFL
jgi:hypothetical protein